MTENRKQDDPAESSQKADSAVADKANMAETDTNSTTTDVGKVLLNEINKPARRDVLGVWNAIRVPVLAVLTGLVLGGIFIIATTETVYAAFGTSIGAGLNEAWRVVIEAYGALFSGSLGDPARMVAALRNGDALEIRRAFNPFLESLVTSTPYIFAGLGVALGFRAGVFNIGAEGQIFMGAIFSAYVGYAIKGLPAVIHIPVALLAGAIGGGIWGFIPGWLKAKVGGHEVINTIMMNYIAFRMSDWLLSGPMKRPNSFNPISPTIEESAMLPQFFGDPIRFHLGFFVALGTAALVSWFLFKTIWGFDLRTVGANPFAGRYAGMKVSTNIMLAMTLSGALCGLAGTNEVRGLNHNLAMAFSSGYGFDSIALALLGNNTPLGVVLASLLFGTLRTGATRMQLVSAIPVDIISVLQAIILALIAAPVIVRVLFNLRTVTVSQTVTVKGWGGK